MTDESLGELIEVKVEYGDVNFENIFNKIADIAARHNGHYSERQGAIDDQFIKRKYLIFEIGGDPNKFSRDVKELEYVKSASVEEARK